MYRYLPANKRIIHFLLNGKKKTHSIYDRIIANVQDKIDTNEINESSSIVELYLLERKQRINDGNPKADLCTDEQLRHLLADLFGAGVDTTLTTLRWFLLFVAHDKKIQSKIKQVLIYLKMNYIIESHNSYKILLGNANKFGRCRTDAQRF